ncbi:hypothetical protein I4U23_023682 [Adineta vaga]|nr:hypothetical protein I4U23_023682 [Adineta vaga]
MTSSTYNDKRDTNSEYQNEAFQKAKFANGIPKAKDPTNTGQPEKIKDTSNPVNYNDSNPNQKPHYNAGPKGSKLKQHHYFEHYNKI